MSSARESRARRQINGLATGMHSNCHNRFGSGTIRWRRYYRYSTSRTAMHKGALLMRVFVTHFSAAAPAPAIDIYYREFRESFVRLTVPCPLRNLHYPGHTIQSACTRVVPSAWKFTHRKNWLVTYANNTQSSNQVGCGCLSFWYDSIEAGTGNWQLSIVLPAIVVWRNIRSLASFPYPIVGPGTKC